MKPRIELSPKLLRHYRLRRGLSLKQAGECLRRRSAQTNASLANMYERIERTGITSPERASTIAAELGVAVEVLSGERLDDDVSSEWWLESSSLIPGPTLLQGTGALSNCLQDSVDREWSVNLMAQLPIHARIDMSRMECKLTFWQPDLPQLEPTCWSIRAAARSEKGIIWLEFTKYERETLLECATRTARWSADVMHVNGREVPASMSEVAYNLRLVKRDKDLALLVDQYFMKSSQLCAFLVRELKRTGAKHISVDASRDGLTVATIPGEGLFAVSRVWRRTCRNQWMLCPWSSASVRRLGEEVEARLERAISNISFCDFDYTMKSFVPRRGRESARARPAAKCPPGT